jgi:hypothetical protein
VDHAQHLPRAFPWRTATIVVGAVAAVELLALIGIGATHVASSLRPHARSAVHAARTAPVAHKHVVLHVVAPPARPLRARSHLSVLVLNGNGINGAAGREAVSLQTLGYGSSSSADAQRHDYARSMVLYVPGYAQEARRLGHDAGVRLVAPVDGMSKAQLKGSQLVVVLGGS